MKQTKCWCPFVEENHTWFHGKKLSEGDILYVNGISFEVMDIDDDGDVSMNFVNNNWLTVKELEMLGFSWNAK